jgi:hypothetical protein
MPEFSRRISSVRVTGTLNQPKYESMNSQVLGIFVSSQTFQVNRHNRTRDLPFPRTFIFQNLTTSCLLVVKETRRHAANAILHFSKSPAGSTLHRT